MRAVHVCLWHKYLDVIKIARWLRWSSGYVSLFSKQSWILTPNNQDLFSFPEQTRRHPRLRLKGALFLPTDALCITSPRLTVAETVAIGLYILSLKFFEHTLIKRMVKVFIAPEYPITGGAEQSGQPCAAHGTLHSGISRAGRHSRSRKHINNISTSLGKQSYSCRDFKRNISALLA